MNSLFKLSLIVIAAAAIASMASTSGAQCPAKPPLNNHNGAGLNPCLCLIQGEQVGAVFTPPAIDYPLEVLAVGVFWGSQFGGNPASLEQAIHVYSGGLPNPGLPVHTDPGPLLTDGVMNIITLTSPVVIGAGPITATLEILNNSAGNAFASSVVDDQNGCVAGQNVVFTSNQWADACLLGVTGDWVFALIYRPCVTTVPTNETNWGIIKTLYAGN